MDLLKRRTIKILSAAGIGAAFTSGNVFSAFSSTVKSAANPAANPIINPDVARGSAGPLKIEIITGRSVRENTVIFVNNSKNTISVTEFLPGIVTQNDQMMNLNTLLANQRILIKPGYPLATNAAIWQPLSLECKSSYLWCDASVSRLPGADTGLSGYSDTGVISINATVVNGRAMLTAEHNNATIS